MLVLGTPTTVAVLVAVIAVAIAVLTGVLTARRGDALVLSLAVPAAALVGNHVDTLGRLVLAPAVVLIAGVLAGFADRHGGYDHGGGRRRAADSHDCSTVRH